MLAPCWRFLLIPFHLKSRYKEVNYIFSSPDYSFQKKSSRLLIKIFEEELQVSDVNEKKGNIICLCK